MRKKTMKILPATDTSPAYTNGFWLQSIRAIRTMLANQSNVKWLPFFFFCSSHTPLCLLVFCFFSIRVLNCQIDMQWKENSWNFRCIIENPISTPIRRELMFRAIWYYSGGQCVSDFSRKFVPLNQTVHLSSFIFFIFETRKEIWALNA